MVTSKGNEYRRKISERRRENYRKEKQFYALCNLKNIWHAKERGERDDGRARSKVPTAGVKL